AHGNIEATVAATLSATKRATREGKRWQGAERCGPSQSKPAVAAALNKNEMSNAVSGSSNQPRRNAQPSERGALDARPIAFARKAALSMKAARNAEPLPPAKSA